MSEKLFQVKVLDENGVLQGEAQMLTEKQLDELEGGLLEGWKAEYV
jgi:hypothetical protein